jgi:hypothetical protein
MGTNLTPYFWTVFTCLVVSGLLLTGLAVALWANLAERRHTHHSPAARHLPQHLPR